MARNLLLSDSVTIASSGTTSTTLQMTKGRVPLAIVTPAALTGTSFTFQSSHDDSTYCDLYNGSTLYSVTVGTSRYVALNPDVMQGVQFIRVVSGSAEGATRTIRVISGEL